MVVLFTLDAVVCVFTITPCTLLNVALCTTHND